MLARGIRAVPADGAYRVAFIMAEPSLLVRARSRRVGELSVGRLTESSYCSAVVGDRG
jgi:hypothetical protein